MGPGLSEPHHHGKPPHDVDMGPEDPALPCSALPPSPLSPVLAALDHHLAEPSPRAR
jgi:hypothetical protein